MSKGRKHFKKKKQLPLDIKQLECELKVGVYGVLPNKTGEVKKNPEEGRDVLAEECAETLGCHVCDDMRGHGMREKRATLAFSE